MRQPNGVTAGQAGSAARNAARNRVLKAGIIAYNQLGSTMPCPVRDFSNKDARLILELAMTPPDTFVLVIELDGSEVDCAVKWRRGREIGVAFVSEVRASAYRRKQIVIPTRLDKLSLRRKNLIR